MHLVLGLSPCLRCSRKKKRPPQEEEDEAAGLLDQPEEIHSEGSESLRRTTGTKGHPPRPKAGLPFPARTVAILALVMVVHMFTFMSLFPYVGMMVSELLQLESINEAAGFYAGAVSSAFTLGRFLSGYFWGHVSDSCGRKLVIIIGLLTTTIVSLTFGLSTKYWVALSSSRFVLGLMNGITPAVRTILHDICGTEHVVQAFAYIDGTKAVGIVFGSAIGGLLVQPAEHYPSLFSATGVFGRFPFLLPNLVAAGSSLLLLPIVVLFLPETKGLEGQRPREPNPSSARYGTFNSRKGKSKVEFGEEASNATTLASAPTKGQQTPEPGLLGEGGILSTPKVKTILLLACVVQSLFTGFEEVYPLWAISIVSVGGLGWSTVEIGKVLLTTGLVMVPLQLFIFPSFVKALGAVRWMRMGCFLGTVAVLATPNATFVGFNNLTLFVFSVASTTVVNCSFSAVGMSLSVASTSIVPSRLRGKLSGLYHMAESSGRFIGAIGFAAMFAWSITPHSTPHAWVDHHFAFYVFALALSVVLVLARRTLTSDIFGKEAAATADARGGDATKEGYMYA
ncbi:unnamed protein product [Ectocarpus sp. 4 AP-2014]